MHPKVSVIVPVYNSEKYIVQCIKSILEQDYSYFELLIINDGSTDNSLGLCRDVCRNDSRTRIFDQTNQGVSASRNKGIDESKGEFILFVDSDDYLEKDCLTELLKNPDADLTYMSSNVLYDTMDVTSYKMHEKYLSDRNEIEEEILHLKANPQNFVYFGYTWNKLFKAEIIKKNNIRFINGLSFYEDDAFTLEYFKYVNTLKTIPLCLYNYRITSTGLTMASNSCEEMEMLVDSNIRNIGYFSNTSLVDYELHRLFNIMMQAIRQAQKQSRKRMFMHLTEKAHSLYMEYIRHRRNIKIRKVYNKKYLWMFRLNVLLHKK